MVDARRAQAKSPTHIQDAAPKLAESRALPTRGSLSLLGRADIYQFHLDRVSRSFAFCIRRLESPLRETVGLAYLLCRVLDSIEDAAWADADSQAESFRQFDALLRGLSWSPKSPEWATAADAWRKGLPELPAAERDLVDQIELLASDYRGLSSPVAQHFENLMASMSTGMRSFLGRPSNSGGLVLSSMRDLNRYCFFVAGVVGELLTNLTDPDPRGPARERLTDAFHFGLFLQKINVLKDQPEDEAAGRRLVFSRRSVENSLREHSQRALKYIISIPANQVDFRVFCAWSMGLGLASLPFLNRRYGRWLKGEAASQEDKIDRSVVEPLLQRIERAAADDNDLERELRAQFPPGWSEAGVEERESRDLAGSLESTEGGARESVGIVRQAYRGLLTDDGLLSLGI